ncbi:hypothetical protein P7K49_023186, partial [Saguinus oedipus]
VIHVTCDHRQAADPKQYLTEARTIPYGGSAAVVSGVAGAREPVTGGPLGASAPGYQSLLTG